MPKTPSPVLRWLPVLVWMAVIFAASSDSGSFQHSSRIIAPFLHWLFPQISDAALHDTIVFVRKCAHFTEYAILALFVWLALRTGSSGLHAGSLDQKTPPWQWTHFSQALLVVLFYAATDEFHQKFVPSREASILDVLLDTSGGFFALLFLWILGRLRKRW